MVERLISAGEAINTRNMKKKTALQLAEINGHDEIVVALERAGGKGIKEMN